MLYEVITTSGSTPEIGKKIDSLYKSIITAGTHLAPSLKVAEAAKVIENSQRDLNIAFVNELAKIFNNLGIDTSEVLEAASTKWNFLPFKPGLVGGHCIGVDPYYLAQKAQETVITSYSIHYTKLYESELYYVHHGGHSVARCGRAQVLSLPVDAALTK